jgi:hypothetical protein
MRTTSTPACWLALTADLRLRPSRARQQRECEPSNQPRPIDLLSCLLFISLLLKLEGAGAFDPLARSVLDDFSQRDLGFGDLGDLAEVLAEVVPTLT